MLGLEPALSLQYALPYLRERQGNIINISSLVGSIGQKDAAPYVATKVTWCPCNFFPHFPKFQPKKKKSCNVMFCPQGGDHFHDKGDGGGWEPLQCESQLVRQTGVRVRSGLFSCISTERKETIYELISTLTTDTGYKNVLLQLGKSNLISNSLWVSTVFLHS